MLLKIDFTSSTEVKNLLACNFFMDEDIKNCTIKNETKL